jgi:hypothetical protein
MGHKTPAHFHLQHYCGTFLAPFNISNLHSWYIVRSPRKVHVIFLRLQPKVEMSWINCTRNLPASNLKKKNVKRFRRHSTHGHVGGHVDEHDRKNKSKDFGNFRCGPRKKKNSVRNNNEFHNLYTH